MFWRILFGIFAYRRDEFDSKKPFYSVRAFLQLFFFVFFFIFISFVITLIYLVVAFVIEYINKSLKPHELKNDNETIFVLC